MIQLPDIRCGTAQFWTTQMRIAELYASLVTASNHSTNADGSGIDDVIGEHLLPREGGRPNLKPVGVTPQVSRSQAAAA